MVETDALPPKVAHLTENIWWTDEPWDFLGVLFVKNQMEPTKIGSACFS